MTFVNSYNPPVSAVSDYTSRDYASIYSDLIARIPVYFPAWTSQSQNDFGIVLLELFAYVGDLLGYYLDRLAGEAFIQTATQAVSILNLAAMLDYQPTLSIGAVANLAITISPTLASSYYPYTIPAGTLFSTPSSASQTAIVFQTVAPLTVVGPSGATPSYVGYVNALQGTTQSNEQVATSDGTINQIYPLLYNPVSAGSADVMVDIGLGPQAWSYVQTLINAGPTSQVFTTFVDANSVFYIIFGDGVNGVVPPLGSPITCTYQTNSGATGNVGAGTITVPVTGLVGVIACTNPLPASGGANAESLASIQQNAPASLGALNRAVTVADVQTLAIQVPGVEWASANSVTYQLVNLYIAPFGGGAPSAQLVTAVQQYLTGPYPLVPLVMANTTINILSPTYVPVNVTVNVTAYSNYGNTTTQNLIIAVLNAVLSLQNTGFAFRISLGMLYQVILSQNGVNWAAITQLNRQMLVTTTTNILGGSPITAISVTPLPQPVYAGDTVIVTNASLQQFTAIVGSGGASVGAVSIPLNSVIPAFLFPVSSSVQDTGVGGAGVFDCVFLNNEIPVVGSLTINVTGGIPGS